MSYTKKYDIGNIRLDSPYSHFIYELPLLSFGDVRRGINLSLVFQSKTTENPHYISKGYKFSLQKRLILNSSGIPESLEEGNGSLLPLNAFTDKFTFNDGSHRILRKFGDGTYMLENPDMSVERYDRSGRITSATDKYGEQYLTYTYYNGKLDAITCPGNKTLKFIYSTGIGMVEEVRYIYADETICSMTFIYPGSANVTVRHYSGVTYTITYSNNSLVAYSTNTGSVYSTTYSHKLTCNIGATESGERKITTTRYIGSKEIDRSDYTFLASFGTYKFRAVNITNKDGITTRVQYEDDNPRYSYEVMDIDDSQYENIFFDDVDGNTIYKGVVSINKDDICGQQTKDDGIRMTPLTNSYSHWRALLTSSENIYGNFQISGWIEPSYTTSCTVTVSDNLTDVVYGSKEITNLIPDKWNYFSFRCYMSNPGDVLVTLNYDLNSVINAFDFRLTFEEGSVYGSTLDRYMSKQDIIIAAEDVNNGNPLYIDDKLTFYNGNTQLPYSFTARDILRYKINQQYGQYKNEIYYNDGKGIISGASTFKVGYISADNNTALENITDVAVGQLRMRKEKCYITKMNLYTDSDDNVYFASKSYDGNNEVQSVIYDENLDPRSVTAYEVTTVTQRDNGLITSESASNLYARTITYGEDTTGNITVQETNEFDNTTTYTIDPIWGATISVTLPDGTIITDSYDDDKSTLTNREFGTNSGRATSFGYSNGNLSSLSANGLSYDFAHTFGNLCSVEKLNSVIEEHFLSNNDKTLSSYYPNNSNAVYSAVSNIDSYGRLLEVSGEITNTYDIRPHYSTNIYDIVGKNCGTSLLATSTDHTTGKVTKYAYDKERVTRAGVFSSENLVTENIFGYDDAGRLELSKYTYPVGANIYNAVKDKIVYINSASDSNMDGRVATYTVSLTDGNLNTADMATTYNAYDNYKRLLTKSTSLGSSVFRKIYEYDFSRIASVGETYGSKNVGTDAFEYDSCGRIVSHSYSSVNRSYNNTYVYDSLGQLVRENNQGLDKTYVYCYDNIGNITSVKAYSYTTSATPSGNYTTTSLSYDSTITDRLTAYGINDISYDSIGYPTSFSNKKYVWNKGKLARIYDDVSENDSASAQDVRFTYNAYGQRTSKTYFYNPGENYSGDYLVSSVTTYDYDGSGRLIREFCTQRFYESDDVTREFVYLYDENGIIGVAYSLNGATLEPYYYRRNPQGDVIAIYNAFGQRKAEYAYDAWGNCKVTNSSLYDLAHNNPIRYRGYYYDRETKLYYLNARYYNPEWRRFISPDSTEYIDPENPNGLNLYAYCNNDPVNYADPSGCLAISTIIIGCLVAFAVGSAASAVSQGIQYGWDEISVGQVLVDGAFAAASVALSATGLHVLASVGVGAAMGFGQYAIGSAFHNEALTLQGVIISTVLGGIGGAISGAGTKNLRTLASIYDDMTGRAAQGVKALITAAQRYGFGSKQYALVNNLYGKAIQTAVNQGIKKAFVGSTIKIIGTTIVNPFVSMGSNSLVDFIMN